MEPKCPYMVGKGNCDEYYAFCDLNNTLCLVEYGNSCHIYDEFLEEVDNV